MLKLHKGKKSAEKKRKKEEEKDKAELELLKRERAKDQAEVAEGKRTPFEDQTTSEPRAESEDWKKFLELTAGVDSVLSRTQEDLSRIKAEKKAKKEATPVQSPDKNWIGFEQGFEEDEELKRIEEEKNKREESPVVEYEDPFLVAASPEASFEREEEDIFNTDYIDAVAAVEFAYIPDSPTFDSNDPDPFDTTSVEKIVAQIPRESEKKKKGKLITLGNAAEVLAGIAEKPKALELKEPKKKVAPNEINLLGDEVVHLNTEVIAPSKTLLDDSPPGYLPENPPVGVVESEPKSPNTVEEEEDEFAQLAFESLSRQIDVPFKVEGLIPLDSILTDIDTADDPFDTACAEKLLKKEILTQTKKPSPIRPPPSKRPSPALLFDIFSPTRPRGESFEQFSNPGSRKVSPPTEAPKISLPPLNKVSLSTEGSVRSGVCRVASAESDDFNPREGEKAIEISPVEVRIADIPDSPETSGDFDPFDTSSLRLEAIDLEKEETAGEVTSTFASVEAIREETTGEVDPFDTATVGL